MRNHQLAFLESIKRLYENGILSYEEAYLKLCELYEKQGYSTVHADILATRTLVLIEVKR